MEELIVILKSIDPCCGVALRRGSKFIALVDMVSSVATGTITASLLIISMFSKSENEKSVTIVTDKTEEEKRVSILYGSGYYTSFIFLLFLYSFLSYLMGQSLLTATKEKDVKRITRWLKVSLTLLLIKASGFALSILILISAHFGITFLLFFSSLYSAYSLWVVTLFRKELLSDEAIVLSQWEREHNQRRQEENGLSLGAYIQQRENE